MVSRDAVPKTAGGMVTDLRASNPHPSIVLHALSAHNQCNDPDGEHFIIATLDSPKRGQRPATGDHLVCIALDGHSGGPDDNDAQAGRLIVGCYDDPRRFDAKGIHRGGDHGDTHPPLNTADPQKVLAFAWQQGVSPNDRSYPVRAGDYAGSLSSTRHDAVFDRRVGVRRLTPTECERLQGFPDGWTAVNGMKDGPRYRMLGNAVCVPVAGWIGGRIARLTE